jgi:hypothetical protein
MPYKIPKIPIFPELVGTERRVQDLQIKIAELDWLESSFGLAKRVTIERGEELEQKPTVYEGAKRDSIDVSMWPNDAIKSYSFWDLIDPDEYLYFENNNIRRSYPTVVAPVALIVCLDNKRISQNQDYNVTHSICKNELIQKLNTVNGFGGTYRIAAINQNKPIEVFDGYDVDDNLMEPQSCIRIEGTITYTMDCDEGVSPSVTVDGIVTKSGSFIITKQDGETIITKQ